MLWLYRGALVIYPLRLRFAYREQMLQTLRDAYSDRNIGTVLSGFALINIGTVHFWFRAY
jgi:hypothetical protein